MFAHDLVQLCFWLMWSNSGFWLMWSNSGFWLMWSIFGFWLMRVDSGFWLMWSISGFWLMRVDSGFWLMWSNSGVSDHTTLHYSPPPPPRPPITSPCPLLINTTATASLIQTTHAVLFSFDQLNFFDLDTRSCSLLMKWGSKQSLYPLHRRSQKGYHRNLFKKLKVSSIKHRKTKYSFLISFRF